MKKEGRSKRGGEREREKESARQTERQRRSLEQFTWRAAEDGRAKTSLDDQEVPRKSSCLHGSDDRDAEDGESERDCRRVTRGRKEAAAE